ncbi:pyridoxal phosphate-dependent aminotransferase [Membranihabitans marinus]|uniref:pyridoxal phosphate-dependent aminotransferase n=1 Tax=Membranihabitans marinus TaxID=1227546 RepID=UPI001F423DA8|nr:pyridoxal phosphate-dependent aminotransferase [Membranihabitans marinus]
MKKSFDDMISHRVKNMNESATIKMAQKARDLKAQGHQVIALSLGEPDFDTPDFIKESAIQALRDGKTKYTPVPGIMELREAIVNKFKRDNQLEYKPSQIVVSNGAKQSIANVCLSLLNEGDDALVFTPYWVSYYEIIKLCGANPILIDAPIDQDFKVTPAQLEAAITPNTEIVIFSSPCNPTGSVYSREELEGLAEVLRKYPNIIIISDEIYEYINFGEPHVSIGSLEGMIDRTVTVNGFSKGYAMTGWRLGYIGGPQWLASACGKIQGQITSGANSFSQYAAVAALNQESTERQEMVKKFEKRKALVIEKLKNIPNIKVPNPTGAFYIFPDVSAYFGKSDGSQTIENADDFAEYILMTAHVAIVSGSAFGNNDCVRISYAAAEEELIEALSRIQTALAKLS